jgi:hypothetical protein
MGTFYYAGHEALELEDRALAHLQVVVIDKLRRQESFSLSLTDGRRVVMMWVTPFSPMEFVYGGSRRPTLNQDWLEALAHHAGLTGTLAVLPEPRHPAGAPAKDEDAS